MTPEELAGGFVSPGAPGPSSRIEESFRRRLAPLPPATRLLLLVAAAEPLRDPVLVWRAAKQLGIKVEAAAAAAAAGLIEFGGQVRFRHPLARSAAYRAASPEERQSVHRALAEAMDPDVDPDRRAWHLAHASPGLDEDVAAELERSAGRARVRGGLAAAAAFHERAAELTPIRPGGPAVHWLRRRPSTRPARPTPRCGCWLWRRRDRSMSWGGHVWSCWAPSWRPTPVVAATRRSCCSGRPSASNRFTLD